MIKPSVVKNKLFSVLSNIENNISSYVKNPMSDMTRHRYCPFLDTVLATFTLSMGRTNTELLNYFGINADHIPSKSAFTQQRSKFNDKLFAQILSDINTAIPFNKTYKGYHILAVDGSDLNIPTDSKDDIYRIKQARSDNYYYQMHLNALYDIFEKRFYSLVIQPRPSMNEPKAFCKMVDDYNINGKAIFIADRGYASLNTIAHLLDNNKFFLIRVKSPSSSGSLLRKILKDGLEADKNVSIGVTRSRKKEYIKHPEKYKVLKKDRVFDSIPNEDTDTVRYLNIRCSCVKLNDNSYEYLVSNLPVEDFSTEDLKYLYWKRWGIETSFRTLKYAASLVYLHSVKRELIIQEIYAKIILYNVSSLIHAYVNESEKLKAINNARHKKYHVSFEDTIPITKEFLKGNVSESKVKALLLTHLTHEKEYICFPRKICSQRVRSLSNRA